MWLSECQINISQLCMLSTRHFTPKGGLISSLACMSVNPDHDGKLPGICRSNCVPEAEVAHESCSCQAHQRLSSCNQPLTALKLLCISQADLMATAFSLGIGIATELKMQLTSAEVQ